MTVDAIRFENFMGFQDTGWIELGAISLLFGRNSSGKSAIIRALRLLKQSHQFGTATQPLVFTARDGVDLGDYLTAMYRTAPVERYLSVSEAGAYQRPPKPRLEIPPMVFHFRCSLPRLVEKIRERLNRTRQHPLQAQEMSLAVEL